MIDCLVERLGVFLVKGFMVVMMGLVVDYVFVSIKFMMCCL